MRDPQEGPAREDPRDELVPGRHEDRPQRVRQLQVHLEHGTYPGATARAIANDGRRLFIELCSFRGQPSSLCFPFFGDPAPMGGIRCDRHHLSQSLEKNGSLVQDTADVAQDLLQNAWGNQIAFPHRRRAARAGTYTRNATVCIKPAKYCATTHITLPRIPPLAHTCVYTRAKFSSRTGVLQRSFACSALCAK